MRPRRCHRGNEIDRGNCAKSLFYLILFPIMDDDVDLLYRALAAPEKLIKFSFGDDRLAHRRGKHLHYIKRRERFRARPDRFSPPVPTPLDQLARYGSAGATSTSGVPSCCAAPPAKLLPSTSRSRQRSRSTAPNLRGCRRGRRQCTAFVEPVLSAALRCSRREELGDGW
jgi:hypothetical protein